MSQSEAAKCDEPELMLLLMAAGNSSRFGSDKRYAQLPNGETVLQKTLDSIQVLELPLKLVVKPEDAGCPLLAKMPVDASQVFISERASHGLGYSLSDAVSHCAAYYRACMIVLADMPFVSTSTYQALIKGWASRQPGVKAVVPVNGEQNRFGHPIIIGSELYAEFSQLNQDKGGWQIISQLGDECFKLSVSDTAIYRDIDVPLDLLDTVN